MDKNKNEFSEQTTDTALTGTKSTTTTKTTTTAKSNANETIKENSLLTATATTNSEKVTTATSIESPALIEPAAAAGAAAATNVATIEQQSAAPQIAISLEDDNTAIGSNVCFADSDTTLIAMPLTEDGQPKGEHDLPLAVKTDNQQLRTSISKILSKTNIYTNSNPKPNSNTNNNDMKTTTNNAAHDIDKSGVSLNNENCVETVEGAVVANAEADAAADAEADAAADAIAYAVANDDDSVGEDKSLDEQKLSATLQTTSKNVAVTYLEIEQNEIVSSPTIENILKSAKQKSTSLSDALLSTIANTTVSGGGKIPANAATALGCASDISATITNNLGVDVAAAVVGGGTVNAATSAVNALADFEGASTSSIRSIGSLVCRICHNSEQPERLVSPCLCKGSLTYVHIDCLERWITLSRSTVCELCQFQYNTEQTLRYTCYQSLRLWYSRAMSRRALQEDCQMFSLLTLVAFGIVGTLLVGIQYYILQGRMWGFDNLLTKGWLIFFLLTTVCLVVYFINIYIIVRSQLTPWYRWWQSARDIKLILENRKPFQVAQKHRILYQQELSVFSINNENPSNAHVAPAIPPPPPPPTPLTGSSQMQFTQQSQDTINSVISPLSTVFTQSGIAALNRACNQVLAGTTNMHQYFDPVPPDDEQS